MWHDKSPDTSPTAYIVNLFDSYADRFDDHLVNTLQYRAPQLLRAAIEPLIDNIRLKGTILDLDCGTGLCGPLFRDIADQLIGVDLSPEMLEKARQRELYDTLQCDDIVTAISAFDGNLAGAIAADVLVYIGRLDPLLASAYNAIQSGAWFAFTTEICTGRDFELEITGRYSHSEEYLRRAAGEHGFDIVSLEKRISRYQGGEPVNVNVTVLRREAKNLS